MHLTKEQFLIFPFEMSFGSEKMAALLNVDHI